MSLLSVPKNKEIKKHKNMSKMEVVMPKSIMDFDFNDARPLPFLSAPSTPKRSGDISLSAPTSPSRMAELYRYFENFEENNNAVIPQSPSGDDFAFDFKSELEENSLSAEELFDGGKIKPLKPSQFEERDPLLSPRSPISQGKNIIREVFSPGKKKDSDPFSTENGRGRERGPAITSNSSRRAARSLSPYRVSEYPWEEEDKVAKQTVASNSSKANNSQLSSNKNSSSSLRKWRLGDFLLFRSASEGRAKDSYSKYPLFFRRPEEAKNSGSSRSADGSGSVSGKRRSKGQASAHELHYTTNKAASEDMKKKTYLPYKHGILGRFAFNPTFVR